MSEETASIDTSPIDALLSIQAKQQQLQQLVERAEASRSKVSEAVFRRVSADYDTRRRALEAEAKPLRRKARQEHARLAPIHERLHRQVEEARLDKEELDFRHDVGELGDDAFAQRSRALEELLATRQRAFAEADELSQRLAAVMGEGDAEPEPAAVAPPSPEPVVRSVPPAEPHVIKPIPPPVPLPPLPPPAPFESVETAAIPRVAAPEPMPEAAPTVAVQPVVAPGDAEETAWIPAEALNEAAKADEEPPGEGTMTMRFARLVSAADPSEEYQLGLRTTIGRTPDNDITISNGLVSRHHAVITFSTTGYEISDLKSGNGTFVNDERVEQRVLLPGDRLKIGPTLLVFHPAEE